MNKKFNQNEKSKRFHYFMTWYLIARTFRLVFCHNIVMQQEIVN